MTVQHRRRIALAAAVIVAIAGKLLGIYDTPLAVLMIGAAGLWGTSRPVQGIALAAVLVSSGVFWSSLDQSGCSVWWDGKAVYAKAAGHLPYVGWDAIAHRVFGCYVSAEAHADIKSRIVKLDEKSFEGHAVELYRTDSGNYWVPKPGRKLLAFLNWEMYVQHDYEHVKSHVQEGDVVVDCGAHVGMFSRYALKKGASKVIAIEPDPVNLACLRENFAEEIRAHRLIVVPVGVWNKATQLRLSVNDENSAGDSFVFGGNELTEKPIEVLPLDDIVKKLGFDRVDFIKMDIEGSERFAIEGSRKTISHFKPRMAICVYHRPDDFQVIPAQVRLARGDYHVYGRDLEPFDQSIRLKVLFFE